MLGGLSPLVLILIAVVIPMAAAEAAAATTAATMLQTVPPRHLRGRVLGAWRTASTGWGLAGPPVLGLILEALGTRTGLVVTGITVAAVLTLGGAAYRRRHGVPDDSMPTSVERTLELVSAVGVESERDARKQDLAARAPELSAA
ncbi:hypothetical protein ACTWP6_24645 [Mycobacterium sp. 4D054]|uniref:hypothetical protein n=1 Tax=Mycobacterium sp. 4D054 TaxID=3457440 RepID=UPI003FD54945